MLYSTNKTLEDDIVEILGHTNMTAKELLKEVKKSGEDFSIQAIYKALNKLKKDHIVLKHVKRYTLSREWAERVIKTLGGELPLPNLKNGETIQYKFRDLEHQDAYWKHLYSMVKAKYPNHPTFYYNAHEFWIHLSERDESERELLGSFSVDNKAYIVIGGNTQLDKVFRKEFQTEHFGIDLRPETSLNRSEYITSLGDYVIKTKISKSLTTAVDAIYNNCTDTYASIQKIRNLSGNKDTVRLELENNPRKARDLRKKLSKNFYIPRELVEKYDLF